MKHDTLHVCMYEFQDNMYTQSSRSYVGIEQKPMPVQIDYGMEQHMVKSWQVQFMRIGVGLD